MALCSATAATRKPAGALSTPFKLLTTNLMCTENTARRACLLERLPLLRRSTGAQALDRRELCTTLASQSKSPA